MWDNPQLLRGTANALFGASLLLVLYGAAHYVLHLPLFAVEQVRLTQVPKEVAQEQVLAVLRSELRGNFFTADLEHTRRALEQLPWVRSVNVRRHFPGRLDVELEEHVAMARWNGEALVNTYGEVFSAETDKVLPNFIGQPGASAEVAQMYAAFGKQLAALKLDIAQISLSPRHAWELRLQNGLVLELGREQMDQRLARFVDVYPYSLAALPLPANYVDLRYRNGFAAYLPRFSAGQQKRS